MIILGIESSCDETGLASIIAKRGCLVILQVHVIQCQKYGGVVPELAREIM